jgi:glutaconate CoA-transferase subunit B
MTDTERPYTTDELNAVFLSRQISDGERALVGANVPVPRAGVLLAHLHHGPNMIVMLAHTRTNLFHEPVMPDFASLTDWRQSRWAESYYIHHEVFEAFDKMTDLFAVGALQIDPYGNANLIGVGDDYRRLKFRGPGAVGTPSAATSVGRYYLYVASHDRRIFVERCDFVSTFGWGEGGDHRRRLGLPGGGPRFCITPLCVFDFEAESKRMRLYALHPGVSIDDVLSNTGFEPIIPRHVPEIESPTEEELRLLRQRIDPGGILRRRVRRSQS